MSKRTLIIAAIVAALVVPLAARAQTEEEADGAPESFAYGSYFECDTTEEWLADAIVDQLIAPIYDAAVEDGTIQAWGWLKHRTGGKWRRVLYRVAPTLDGLLAGTGSLAEKANKANSNAANKFGEICHTHEDYIWSPVAGSGGAGSLEVATSPGKASVSVYMVCDIAREERADEIMESFAGVYDAQVAAGHLDSWGWMSHVVGGKYRRLLNMRGADHSGLMTGWGAVLADVGANHEDALSEFADICGSHQDYLWNIR
jgi:hypothetical protein